MCIKVTSKNQAQHDLQLSLSMLYELLSSGMKTHSRYIKTAALGLFDSSDRLEQIRAMGDPLYASDS